MSTIKTAIVMPGVVPTRIPFLNALAGDGRLHPVVFSMDPAKRSRTRLEVVWDRAHFDVYWPHGFSFGYRTRSGDAWPVHVRPEVHWRLARGNFDAYVTLQWNALYTPATIVQARLARRPVVLWEESISHEAGPWRKRLQPLIRTMFGQFDASIAASNRCKTYLLELGARDGTVFTCRTPIDVDDFRSPLSTITDSTRAEYIQRYRLDGRIPILFIGSLIPRKGVHDLLTAFAALADDLPDVVLLLAGTGTEELALQRRTAEMDLGARVRFVGFLSHRELPLLISLAAIFVLPSHYDPWPAAILEAMSCSLPIVTTSAVGMVPEIVRDGDNGIVVRPKDPSELSAALRRLADNPAERRRMGDRSLHLARSWTVSDAASAFADAVEHAVDSKRRSELGQ
jgi:glycosyltransferase involved in cell wall biosynthesis